MTGIEMTSATGVRLVRSGPIESARQLLRYDAGLCAASGAALLLAAGPLATLADGDPVTEVRGLGVVLLLVAGDLLLLSAVRPSRLATAAWAAAAANGAWVLATVAVVASGVLELAGALLALASAVVVAVFAWKEALAARSVQHAEKRISDLASQPVERKGDNK